MTNTLWILGASDPEMAMIERVLTAFGESYEYALDAAGKRVHPGNAYAAETSRTADSQHDHGLPIVLVECGMRDSAYVTSHIDHHAHGDHGYGRPPAEFFDASSIGQVVHELGYEIDLERGEWSERTREIGLLLPDARDVIHTAAADHCLGAAYAGQCPGVDPDALMAWRIQVRGAYQSRTVREIIADIAAARIELRNAPRLEIPGVGRHVQVADMRRDEPVPELPEAGTRDGIAYVAGPITDPRDPTRRKFVVSGSPYVVRAWMEHWAPQNGLVGLYGDPARGFAGGYAP